MSADTKLKAFIDRVLNSRAREDDEKANTKEIYKEIAEANYDKAMVGKVVNHLRKDQDKAREQSEVFDLYLAAYIGASHVHARVREDDSSTAARKDVRGQMKPEGREPVSRQVALTAGTQAPPVETHPQHDAVEAGEDVVTAASSPDTHQAETPNDVQPECDTDSSGDLRREETASDGQRPKDGEVIADRSTRSSNSEPETSRPPALNSEGLQRLHGCLAPEACGSGQPRAKLCFGCSVQHDGPSPQNGVA